MIHEVVKIILSFRYTLYVMYRYVCEAYDSKWGDANVEYLDHMPPKLTVFYNNLYIRVHVPRAHVCTCVPQY